METGQITVLIVLGILWAIFYFRLGANLYKDNPSKNLYFIGYTLTSALFISLTIISLLLLNEEKKKAQGKCPELEKVENVFKIKN